MAVESILDSTKKVLGIAADYDVFDTDILMHINGMLAVLNQLGIGPTGGLYVEDNTAIWSDFYGTDQNYNLIKTYVYLRVRLLFDPPSSHFLVTALIGQYKEIEWRLSLKREVDLAAFPTLPDPWDPTKIPVVISEEPRFDEEVFSYTLDGGSSR